MESLKIAVFRGLFEN